MYVLVFFYSWYLTRMLNTYVFDGVKDWMNESEIATHQTKLTPLARKKNLVESTSAFYFSANRELVQWLCSDLVICHQGLLERRRLGGWEQDFGLILFTGPKLKTAAVCKNKARNQNTSFSPVRKDLHVSWKCAGCAHFDESEEKMACEGFPVIFPTLHSGLSPRFMHFVFISDTYLGNRVWKLICRKGTQFKTKNSMANCPSLSY